MIAWLNESPADIILLQEVRSTDAQAQQALAPALESGWHWIGAKNQKAKGRAGVGILSRFPLENPTVGFGSAEFDDSGRFLSATAPAAATGLDVDLEVASLYLPSGSAKTDKQDEKYRFLTEFSEYLTTLGERGRDGHHAVIGGDWNICHREQDLKNWKTNRTKSGFLPQERAWMDSVFGCWPDSQPQVSQTEASEREMAAGAFSDGSRWDAPPITEEPLWFDVMRRLHPETEGPWSWWTYRGKAFDTDAGWRIDYQAATEPMLARAAKAFVDKPAAYDLRWTDHAPVVVNYQ